MSILSLKVGSHDRVSIQLTLKIVAFVMENVGVHTVQFLHPINFWRALKTLTILVLRISCLLHRSLTQLWRPACKKYLARSSVGKLRIGSSFHLKVGSHDPILVQLSFKSFFMFLSFTPLIRDSAGKKRSMTSRTTFFLTDPPISTYEDDIQSKKEHGRLRIAPAYVTKNYLMTVQLNMTSQ